MIKIFNLGHSINFIDDSNRLVGYDFEVDCCEKFAISLIDLDVVRELKGSAPRFEKMGAEDVSEYLSKTCGELVCRFEPDNVKFLVPDQVEEGLSECSIDDNSYGVIRGFEECEGDEDNFFYLYAITASGRRKYAIIFENCHNGYYAHNVTIYKVLVDREESL